MCNDKDKIRKIALQNRNNVANFAKKNCEIASKVLKLILDKQITSVFCYVSMRSEVDTTEIIKSIFPSISVFVPHTTNKIMSAVKLDSVDRIFNTDKWGNVYRDDENFVESEKTCPITIVPLVAFDGKCNRLGYGAGCYDRYFDDNETYKIGLAFDEQQMDFPVGEWDIPLDVIVTPTKILRR